MRKTLPHVRGYILWLAALVGLLILGACAGDPDTDQREGPVLLQQNTIAPTLEVPTRAASDTPTPTPATPARTGEALSPLSEVTVEGDFVLVTPTLPPSKTPTSTPTVTQTPTTTPTPTVTVTATSTRQLFPTSIIIPATAPVPQPRAQVCDSQWFFMQPRPESCPLSAPVAGRGVYQEFQNGYMIWVAAQDVIYVMYNDPRRPRWEVYRDQFEEGDKEEDPAYADGPGTGTWQPRRGFGMLWRNNQAVRDRIGWAIQEWEQPYSLQTQVAANGTIYISDPSGGVFGLLPNGSDWQRYSGFSGFQ